MAIAGMKRNGALQLTAEQQHEPLARLDAVIANATASVAEACDRQVGQVRTALSHACETEVRQLRAVLAEACAGETSISDRSGNQMHGMVFRVARTPSSTSTTGLSHRSMAAIWSIVEMYLGWAAHKVSSEIAKSGLRHVRTPSTLARSSEKEAVTHTAPLAPRMSSSSRVRVHSSCGR